MEIENNSDLCEAMDSDENSGEVDSNFPCCQHVHTQSVGPKYVLHLSATKERSPNIAAGLSDYTCDVFNLAEGGLARLSQLKQHENKLINCIFSPGDGSQLYTGSADGTIKLWDLRDSQKPASVFKDDTSDESTTPKVLSCFDVSPCNRLLAAGTESYNGDPFILFWDIRNVQLLGAYWESHTDDITQVKFHPDDSNKVLSGSTDGLINVYNLLETCEEDALQEVLNTEALVEDIQWFYYKNHWKVSCVTSTNDLQLWDLNDAEPYKRINRDNIGLLTKIKAENVYIAKVHAIKEFLFLVCGSNSQEGKNLRSLFYAKSNFTPGFQFKENTQRIRASFINENTNLLLTGGEKGKLDIWKANFSDFNF